MSTPRYLSALTCVDYVGYPAFVNISEVDPPTHDSRGLPIVVDKNPWVRIMVRSKGDGSVNPPQASIDLSREDAMHLLNEVLAKLYRA